MSRWTWARPLFLALTLLAGVSARADLAGAQKAYAAKDFERAYLLYRELAEIGNVTAQENLAAMYVDGEGVKRDNVLGYAWASIARENGGSAVMQNIIDQLQPHLNDAAKARVAEAKALFGKAALQERLLPAPAAAVANATHACRMKTPANPDDSYPPEAARQNISGSVVLDVKVMPDGRVHHPIVLYSIPEGAFENAARVNAFASVFTAPKVNGVAAPCVLRYKVKYLSRDAGADAAMDTALEKTRDVATAGDAVAQALYGLLLMDRSKSSADRPQDWFLKSAQSGVPFAQYVVGVGMVHDGAPEAEVAKGITWLKLAAASGQPEAKFALANYSLDHQKGAATDPIVFAWLEDAAKADHRDARLTLAALLAAGPDARNREPGRAIELITKAKWDFDSDPTAQEVIAAAAAQLGKFDEAQAAQRRAIGLAKDYGWSLTPLAARLELYLQNTRWSGNLMSMENK